MIKRLKNDLRQLGIILSKDGIGSCGRYLRALTAERWIKTRIYYLADYRPHRPPTTVQIEASSKCNLRCPSCSHGGGGNGVNLSPEQLTAILDNLGFHPNQVVLSGTGEPLINPDFLRLLDVLERRRIDCRFFTNGTLLTPQLTDALIGHHCLKTVNFSCDGAQASSFEGLRVGAKFEHWQREVRYFTEAARQRTPPLTATMVTVVSRWNLAEMEDLVQLAADMAFPAMLVLDMVPATDSEGSPDAVSADELADVKSRIREAAGQKKIALSFGLRREHPYRYLRCLTPWTHIVIRADGKVNPCPALFPLDQLPVVGDILSQPFAQIWEGQKYDEFRRASGSGDNPLCKRCPYS